MYPAFATYPGDDWREPGTNDADTSSVQSVTAAAPTFLAEQANEDLGKSEFEPGALTTTDFTVQNVEFYATEDGVSARGRARLLQRRRTDADARTSATTPAVSTGTRGCS